MFLGDTSCSQHPVRWALVSPLQGQVSLWPPQCPAAGLASPLGWSWSSAGSPEQSRRKTLTVLAAAVLRILFLMRADACIYFLQEHHMATDSLYGFGVTNHKTNFSRKLYPPRFCDCLLAIIRPNISLFAGCDTCESLVEHILWWRIVILMFLNNIICFILLWTPHAPTSS